MKKITILLTFIGINALSASTNSAEKVNANRAIDMLIEHDLLVERKVPKSRELRVDREVRANRVVHLGRNSRGVRPQRAVRIVYKSHDKKKISTSATALIKKSYLSKLSK